MRPNDEPRGATFTDVVKPEGCSFKEPERRDEVVSRPDGCSFNPPDNDPLDEVWRPEGFNKLVWSEVPEVSIVENGVVKVLDVPVAVENLDLYEPPKRDEVVVVEVEGAAEEPRFAKMASTVEAMLSGVLVSGTALGAGVAETVAVLAFFSWIEVVPSALWNT